MQALARHVTQHLQCLDTDMQVLANLSTVKVTGHARQLQLAMQRFVGHTQQSAIGHPKTKTVGSNGRRFHIERNGARLGQLLRSEERRVGKEWVGKCRSGWSPYH